MISVNTEYFRTAARHFEKHQRYDDGMKDTYEWHEYWDRERDRCLNGYTIGGMTITGYHYWYLNYWRIKKVYKTQTHQLYGEVFKNRNQAEHKGGFADFWDVDLEFFNEFQQAIRDGQHFVWLKPRGVGASYKGSSILGRNFFLIPESKGYMLAHDKTFLTEDGLFSKFLMGRMHINSAHPEEQRYLTAFGKPSDFKKDQNNMHFRASTSVDNDERGYMSELIGLTFNDKDYQKHRGKRGLIIEIEEMGAFESVETVYNVARSSVEQGNSTYGTILGFGTGGTKASQFGDMEKMTYSPEAYNIRCFDNIWDDGMAGTKCGYFTPAYRNVNFKDEKGNSDEKAAKAHYDYEREQAAKSPDGNALIQVKSEHPYTLQEAILRNTYSVLPSNEALEWHNKVLTSGLYQIGVNGFVSNLDGHLEFKPSEKAVPISKYPHNIKEDLSGCITQYYAPHRINGKVPDNLYIIAHDPYAFDQSTDSESLGAAYVYMVPNNFHGAGFGDRIVATYFGRPKTLDDYNKNLFLLAEYYNAKIGFENDRGDVIGYAKRFKKLEWLADEFELAFDADISKSKVRRQYGMHIGSGKENIRMHKGTKYLADWLLTPRGADSEGVVRLNIHTIFCPATLKEIQMYRPAGGNFDRISALRILAYYQKELVYTESKPKENTDTNTESFFNKKHFR